MRICHITSHLPPDQAANALLPHHLGEWARQAGHDVRFVSHPPRSMGAATTAELDAHARALAGRVVWVPPHRRSGRLSRALRLPSMAGARRISRLAGPVIADSDVVHVHSNGLLPEWCARLAARAGRPVVLTLYGTEIWHYHAKSFGPDLFTRAYRTADRVTFYSKALLDRAIESGLVRSGLSVVYPPVASYFEPATSARREHARAELGISERFVLVNVKRLHPLAGQDTLLAAMPAVIQRFPDTRLLICGTGPLRDDLERLARDLRIESHVTFAGLVDNARIPLYYQAADLFVLPSRLEALPTVAVEALATGTPVVSTDNPGGTELAGVFGPDVAVVPGNDPGALGEAIVAFLKDPRRTQPSTAEAVGRLFTGPVVSRRYLDLYAEVLGSRA